MSQFPESSAETVARLRSDARAARQAVPMADRESGSTDIIERIEALPEVTGSAPGAIVAGFLAFDGEIDVMSTLVQLWTHGHGLAMPRIGAESMTFHLIAEPGSAEAIGGDPTGLTDALTPGPFGILEPAPGAPEPERLGLVLVPLTAFDGQCHRIGMGRGYYDRYFADPGHRPPLIGVAFDAQEVDAIPVRPWDIALDVIVTPSRTIRAPG